MQTWWELHWRSFFLYRRFNRCLWVSLHFKSLHRRVVFRHRWFIRRKTVVLAFWFHCTDEYNLPNVGLTGNSKLSLSCLFWLDFFTVSSILIPWTEEVSGRYPETTVGGGPSGLAKHIFYLSSLEPKSLKMVILTIILVQVLCCLYQSPKHYIEI